MKGMTKLTVSVAAAALGLSVAAATPAVANDGDTTRTANCSGAARSELTLSPENRGTMEIDFQVDANRRGQRWEVTMVKSGRRVHQVVRVTAGRSGSFTAHKLVSNRSGLVRVRAVRLGDGQRCAAGARF
jgi:hypothetical protein